MLKKLTRSVTPRAAGVLVLLVAAAVAAAVTVSTGGGTNAPAHRLSAPAGAKSASGGKSSSSSSATGNGPIVSKAVRHDTSIPLRDIKPAASPHTGPRLSPDAGDGESPGKLPSGGADPVVQNFFGKGQIPATSVNFEGVAVGQGGSWAPPDPNGAVGPNNYFEIVNDGFAIYTKTGAVAMSARPTNTIWSGFGGHCQTSNNGDGTVLYDHIAQRWVIQQFQISSTPYSDCIAVSTTSDPTGSWNRYEFLMTPGSDFNDYPKLGIWSDAYYISYNIFANGQSYSGPEVCAFDKAAMIAGLPATQQCFKKSTSVFSLLPADIDGPTLPPAGSPELLLSMGNNSLQLWKFHVDWTNSANSTLSGPTQFSVAAFTQACGGGTCIPQKGTTQRLDSLGDRLMYRLAYRNFGDHEALVVAQSVNSGGVTGMRWYELRGPWATPTVFQSGTYQPDSTYRWMGSIAQDHVGDMALGFSVSSSSLAPGTRYTGRLVVDALGTMGQGEGTLVSGTGSQINALSRWGDYTSVSVDPTDDCTFWYLGEYLKSNGSWNWHTRIGAFKFPSCTNGGGGSAPIVGSFNPTSGPVGTPVDIAGANFTGATSVTFNGTPDSSFHVNSSTDISAHVPSGATTGLISVSTPNGTGQSSTSFTVTGGGGTAPTVNSFSPTSGPVGTDVTITGTNFTGATGVTFNNTSATFTINSDTSIDASVPAGATTGPIAVTNGSGTGTSSSDFTVTTVGSLPVITSFSPSSGPIGTNVTINGSGFSGVTGVTFGGVATGNFTGVSDSQVTAYVPAGATTGPIAVTTSNGTGTSATNFTVTSGPPSITGFTPTSGYPGYTVTITGTNLTGATAVKLGSVLATFTVNSPTQITATVPKEPYLASYKWSVTTPVSTATSTAYFRYL